MPAGKYPKSRREHGGDDTCCIDFLIVGRDTRLLMTYKTRQIHAFRADTAEAQYYSRYATVSTLNEVDHMKGIKNRYI